MIRALPALGSAADAWRGEAQLNHLNKSEFFIKSRGNLGKIFLKKSG